MNPRVYLLVLLVSTWFGMPLVCAAHPLDLWYPQCTNFAGVPGFQNAAYGNGNFVAVGGAGSIAYSSNNAPWTRICPTSKTISDVTFGGGRFVAVGDTGLIL